MRNARFCVFHNYRISLLFLQILLLILIVNIRQLHTFESLKLSSQDCIKITRNEWKMCELYYNNIAVSVALWYQSLKISNEYSSFLLLSFCFLQNNHHLCIYHLLTKLTHHHNQCCHNHQRKTHPLYFSSEGSI
jgi:uncharacterized paraquat-inducible protein A